MDGFKRASLNLGTLEEFKIENEIMFKDFSEQEIKFQYDRLLADLIFMNDTYQVNVDTNTHRESPIGLPIVHLSIKRIDKEPIHDWRDLQEIKNVIVGEEVDAVELYPAESRRVDSANQYHLWCLPQGNFFPIGWMERFVQDEVEGTNTKQRPFLHTVK